MANTQSDFDNFFEKVLNIEAASFIDDSEDPEVYGLDPYWIKIEIYKHDKAGKVDLYIGSDISDGYYANIDRDRQVFVLSREDINSILSAANKLRGG